MATIIPSASAKNFFEKNTFFVVDHCSCQACERFYRADDNRANLRALVQNLGLLPPINREMNFNPNPVTADEKNRRGMEAEKGKAEPMFKFFDIDAYECAKFA